jgi:membrane-associated protease RseP (regulator of RpoE activity)
MLGAAAFAAERPAVTATATASAGQPTVVKVVDQDGASLDADVVVVANGEAAAGGMAGDQVMVFKTVETTQEGDAAPQVRVVTRVSRASDPNRGWLGVALGEAANNPGGKKGVSVLNVVKGSPAEAAGLQENDVILSINGESTSNVGDVSKKIGELGPDTGITLSIERDGKPMTLNAQLSKAQDGAVEWLYAPSDMVFSQRIEANPHIIKIDPNGQMVFINPGDPASMQNLPGVIAPLLNEKGMNVQVNIDNGKRTTKISSNEDGEITEVTQSGDEPIHVRRYSEGNENDAVENDYATAEELEAADADAAALYKRQAGGVWVSKVGDGENVFTLNFETEDEDGLNGDLHARIAEAMKSAGVSVDDAHRALMEAFQNMPAGAAGAGGGFGKHIVIAERAATRSFKVQPNGQIELTVRENDTEVTTVYKNEADLKARNPEGFAQFERVQKAKVQE